MSKSDNQKYFYFRMKDNFFQSKEIFDMEDEVMYGQPVGDKLIVTLLKLYTFSIDNQGYIVIPNVIGDSEPNEDEWSLIIKYLSKWCRVPQSAMGEYLKYYLKHNFLERVRTDDGYYTLEVKYVVNNTGESSNKADRQRKLDHQKRALLGSGVKNKRKDPEDKLRYDLFTERELKELSNIYDKTQLEREIIMFKTFKELRNISDENNFEEFMKFLEK